MASHSIGTIFVELDLDADRYTKAQQKLYKDATSTTLGIEDNFKKLGIKSSAEMDLMRAKITNSFDMIANSSKATANDILRAEEAKNAQLSALNKLQYGEQVTFLSDLEKNWKAYAATVGIVAAAALYAAYEGVMVCVSAASDLNETINKTNAIFGANAAEMIAWSETSADSMGLSQRASLEAAASIGNMFKQLGAGADVAATNSKEMVELAADIASFNNVSGGAETVLIAMQSAFRGEYDALQKYIPAITAATVEQLALMQTGKEAKDELTALDKATAAYTLIIAGAGDATGDFNKTSGELANMQRTLTAHIEDLEAAIGQAFTPVVRDVVKEMIEWIKANKDVIAQDIKEWADLLAPAIITLTQIVLNASTAFTWWGNALYDVREQMKGIDEIKRIENELKGLTTEIKLSTGETLTYEKAVGLAKETLAEKTDETKKSTEAEKKGAETTTNLIKTIEEATLARKDQTKAEKDYEKAIKEAEREQEKFNETIDKETALDKALAKVVQDLTDAQLEGLKATNEFNASLNNIGNTVSGTAALMEAAFANIENANRDMATSAAEHADTFSSGWTRAVNDIVKEFESPGEYGTWNDLGYTTMLGLQDGLQSAIGEGLFDILKGDCDNFEEYWSTFTDSLYSAFTSSLANMVVGWGMAGVDNWLTGSDWGGAWDAVESFLGLSSGAWNILDDSLAYLHAGEMVLPANTAAVFSDLMDAISGGGAGSFADISPEGTTWGGVDSTLSAAIASMQGTYSGAAVAGLSAALSGSATSSQVIGMMTSGALAGMGMLGAMRAMAEEALGIESNALGTITGLVGTSMLGPVVGMLAGLLGDILGGMLGLNAEAAAWGFDTSALDISAYESYEDTIESLSNALDSLSSMGIDVSSFESAYGDMTGGDGGGYGNAPGGMSGESEGGYSSGAEGNSASPMHTGGMIRLRPDERHIIAQTGEAILSRGAVQMIGGEAGVNALNRGRVGGGMSVTFNVGGNIIGNKKTFEDFVKQIDQAIYKMNRRTHRLARAA